MIFKTEKDFKNIPKLRLARAKDKQLIATAVRQKYRKDHLYWHGPGILGIYYERKSSTGGTYAVSEYVKLIGKSKIVSILNGDLDGIILYKPEGIEDIPKFFFRGRRGRHLVKKDGSRIS